MTSASASAMSSPMRVYSMHEVAFIASLSSSSSAGTHLFYFIFSLSFASLFFLFFGNFWKMYASRVLVLHPRITCVKSRSKRVFVSYCMRYIHMCISL